MQPRILYPARLSFRIGEIKSFPDKQKLKELITTKLSLQEILRRTSWGLTEQKQQRLERKREQHQKQQTLQVTQ